MHTVRKHVIIVETLWRAKSLFTAYGKFTNFKRFQPLMIKILSGLEKRQQQSFSHISILHRLKRAPTHLPSPIPPTPPAMVLSRMMITITAEAGLGCRCWFNVKGLYCLLSYICFRYVRGKVRGGVDAVAEFWESSNILQNTDRCTHSLAFS